MNVSFFTKHNIDFNDWKEVFTLLAIFGCVQFVIITLVSMLIYPGGYSFFNNYFSDLGRTVTKGSNLDNSLDAGLFLITLFLVFVTIIPFWLIIQINFTTSLAQKVLSQIGSAIGIIGSPFLVMVGIFHSNTDPTLHLIGNDVFFLCTAIAIVLYSIAIFMNKNYHIIFGLLGFVFAGLMIIYIYGLPGLYTIFSIQIDAEVTLQKAVVYFGFFWLLVQVLVTRRLINTGTQAKSVS